MSAEVVNLFQARQTVDFTTRPIEVDEWSDRLVRASVKWLQLRRSDVLSFLEIAACVSNNTLIIEFDCSGQNATIVSRSTASATGWLEDALARTVIPKLSFDDEPRGVVLASNVMREPAQLLIIPLPTGQQKFAALLF